MRVWRHLLLALVATIAFPPPASSHDGAGGQYHFGVAAAQIARLPLRVARADPDRDGLTTWQELRIGTNPHKFDTDGDGYGDGDEVRSGTDPLDPHSFPNPVVPPAALAQPTPMSEWSSSPPEGVPEGPGPEQPAAEEPAGGEEPGGEEPDTTPPTVTIDSISKILLGAGDSSTEVRWHASEDGAFSLRRGGSDCTNGAQLSAGAYSGAPSSEDTTIVSASSLAQGANTLRLCVTNAASNTGSATTTVTRDTIAPETTIDSGPSGTTTSTSAVVAFSSGESSSTFECRLDAGGWIPCSSPKSYSSLAVGAHTFSVRATDAAGNTDPTPATRSWTIDSISVSCTQTLSPGANLSNAISGAASGAVLCLEGGTWSFDLSNVDKSSTVTVSSAEGTTATLGHSQLSKSSNLRFQDLHFTDGIDLLGSSSQIEILDSEFTGEYGVHANGEDASHHTAVSDVTIEGNYMHDFDFSGSEGVTGGYGITVVNGVEHFTIRGNTIESVANDYIQSASPVDFTVDGNTFLGPSLRYGHSSVHQDLWQIFGGGDDVVFTDNVARNTGTNESLLFQEGTFHNTVVENNLLINDSDGYTCQIYQQQGLVFRHNTIVDSHWGCLFRDNGGTAGSGYQVDHNIFVGTEDNPDLSTQSRASGWGTYDYNVSEDGSAGGAHSVRNWSPSWLDTTDYAPQGLPFEAGYAAP
jgi:Bacterial TSP3 repeat